MLGHEKVQRFAEFQRALPFLRVREFALTYRGEVVLEYIPNLFYGRLYYGPFYVGGPSPFYSLVIPPWGPRLYFEDDIGRTLYATTEDLEEQTECFWQALDKQVARVRDLAAAAWWNPLHLRMWLGAVAWLRGWTLPSWVQHIDAIVLALAKRRCDHGQRKVRHS